MAFKDQVVELVLRAKNMISGDTDAAATSVDKLAGSAGELQSQLRSLEDQATLITQFDKASKAVDRTSSAYDQAQVRLAKLSEKLDTTGPLTERQAREFAAAQAAVERTEKAYRDAEGTLGTLAQEAQAAGVDITDLSGAQRENQKRTTETKRALEDYNKELDEGEGRLKRFGKGLVSGAAKFTAWAAAAGAAAVAAGAAGLAKLTKDAAGYADQLTNTSLQLGISTTRLQEFTAATRTVGVEQSQLTSILKDMTKNIGQAADGGGRFAPILKKIGLEVKDLIGLSPDEQLLKIADAISGMTQEEQVNILERMGSGASKLLPLLQGNAAELQRIVEAARDRGAIMSEDEVQRLVQVQDALNRINERMEGLRNRVVAAVAPTFEELARIIDETFDAESAQEFMGAMEGIAKQLIGWIHNTISNFDQLKGSVQTLFDTFEFLGNSAAMVFRGVQTLAAGVVAGVAKVATEIARQVEGVVRLAGMVGLASDEAVERAASRTRALEETTQDLVDRAVEYARQSAAAGKAAVNAFDNTTAATNRASEAADKLNEAAKQNSEIMRNKAGAAIEAARSAGDYERAQRLLSGALAGTGEALRVAQELMKRDPTPEAAAEVERLQARYNELKEALDAAATGTQSLQDVQRGLKQELSELALAIKAAQDEFARDATSENQKRLQALVKEYDEVADRLKGINQLSGTSSEGIRTSAEVLQGAVGDVNKSLQETHKNQKEYFRVIDTGFGNTEQRMKDFAEVTEGTANSVGASLSGVVNNWFAHISALSRRALAAFQEALGARGAGQVTDELEMRLAAVNNRISDMSTRLRAGGGVGKVLRDWAQAGFEVEQSFLEQAIAVRDLTQSILEGDRSASVLRKTASQIVDQFNLLDQQQLSGLLAAVDSVQREVSGLRQSLQDTISSLQQELASLRGDTAQVEQLRYLEKRQELEAQYQYARRLGDRDTMEAARQALQLSEQAHQIRMKNAREQDEAARKSAAERAARDEFERQRSEQEERQDISRAAAENMAQLRQQGGTSRTVTLQFAAPNGRSLASIDVPEQAGVDQLLDALERGGYLTARQ